MDPDSFMTIYDTFRRGAQPALGFLAANEAGPPTPVSDATRFEVRRADVTASTGQGWVVGVRHLFHC